MGEIERWRKNWFIHVDEIRKAATDTKFLMKEIENAFVAYSKGACQIPPVGYLAFPSEHGSTHIKYGHIHGDKVFVVKIATGFSENFKYGLPTGSGIVLVFNAVTGRVEAILADEGYLTDLRTALAGAICAKYLAPANIKAIGIIGTGVQARKQLVALKAITTQKNVFVYGRNQEHVIEYIREMSEEGFHVTAVSSPKEVAANCNLIVTTTSSRG